MWNYNKEGAWERFSELTNKYFDKFINDIEDKNIPIDEILEKFNKIQNKIKFQAFGKITIKNQVVSGNSAKTKPTEFEKKSHVRNAVSDSVEKPNPLTTEGKLIKDILVRQSNRIEKVINDVKNIPYGGTIKVFKLLEKIQGQKNTTRSFCYYG